MHVLVSCFQICAYFACLLTVSSSSNFGWSLRGNRTSPVGFQYGNISIGGLFPVHNPSATFSTGCGILNHDRGIHRLEGMFFAIDKVNNDPSILPQLTLGAEVRDTCGQVTYALEEAVQFVMAKLNHRREHCSSMDEKIGGTSLQEENSLIVGVIGAASSAVTLEVASLFRLFALPQISYASTSVELSDEERYSFFTRTVPSDAYQAKAMIDIVDYFGWKSVFLLFSEGSYGEAGAAQVEKSVRNKSICIVKKVKIEKASNLGDIIESFGRFPKTNVVLLFCNTAHIKELLLESKRAKRNFTWIGSDFWGTRTIFLENSGLDAVANRAITLTLRTDRLESFQDYFVKLTPDNKRNPWFKDFWEEHFNCSLTDKEQKEKCSSKKIDRNYQVDDKVPYVIDSVLAFAHALDKLYRTHCPLLTGLCDGLLNITGKEVMETLRSTRFNGTLGPIDFTLNGSAFHGYDVMQFKHGAFHKVGTWRDTLAINTTEFANEEQYSLDSACGEQCDNGYIRIPMKEGPPCCYNCQACGERQFATADDQCVTCPDGYTPNKTKSGCVHLPIKHMSQTLVVLVTSFAGIGILLTSGIVLVFMYYNDTPVVRASARELSYPLLVGLFLCYFLTYVIVSDVTEVTCGITRFGLGFSFSICYGALLTKTNRLARVFGRKVVTTRGPRFVSPKSQVVIIFLIAIVEGVLAVGGLLYEGPLLKRVLSTQISGEYLFYVCYFPPYDAFLAFFFNAVLILTCTVYAIRTRKVPTHFNEAKYLGFVMYTTCIIWIASVPVYFGIDGEYRVIAIAINIILSATSIIVGVFGPKIYIIMFRPARNVRSRSTVTFSHSMSGIQDGGIDPNLARKMTILTNSSVEVAASFRTETAVSRSPEKANNPQQGQTATK